jgi:hypothetical protein
VLWLPSGGQYSELAPTSQGLSVSRLFAAVSTVSSRPRVASPLRASHSAHFPDFAFQEASILWLDQWLPR